MSARAPNALPLRLPLREFDELLVLPPFVDILRDAEPDPVEPWRASEANFLPEALPKDDRRATALLQTDSPSPLARPPLPVTDEVEPRLPPLPQTRVKSPSGLDDRPMVFDGPGIWVPSSTGLPSELVAEDADVGPAGTPIGAVEASIGGGLVAASRLLRSSLFLSRLSTTKPALLGFGVVTMSDFGVGGSSDTALSALVLGGDGVLLSG